ncbi:hypothetical protein [Desulfurobacterium sp.]
MKKFKINTIIVGFIFLTVFTCGETPAGFFSPVNFSVEKIEVIDNRENLEVRSKSERSVFLPLDHFLKNSKKSYSFSDIFAQISFCFFMVKSLPPRASPVF